MPDGSTDSGMATKHGGAASERPSRRRPTTIAARRSVSPEAPSSPALRTPSISRSACLSGCSSASARTASGRSRRGPKSIRRTASSGSRFAGRTGPSVYAGERVLVVEGGSDCAAGLALGRWTIGRPSVLARFREIRRLLTRRRPGLVSVVADRDEHEAGIRGARQLARCLESVAPDVLVVEPPAGIKDLRSWLHRGLEERELRRVEEASR